VLATESSRSLIQPELLHDKYVRVGPWMIDAQLDPADKPSLEIRSLDDKCALAVNRSALMLGGKTYQVDDPEFSILVENTSGRTMIGKVTDTAPR